MDKPLNHRKLPPLSSLKGFESTARQLSFRKAAAELSLTHPAISHQIQSLEESLGVKLFIRGSRQLTLTPDGQRYYPIIREALEMLINGSETIRRSANPSTLRIQTYISISIRWLSHRLPRFRGLHPELQLQLISSIQEQYFDETNADVGLIFCRRPHETHLSWIPLFKPTLFPVCAPQLIDHKTNLLAEDLLDYPLITVTSESWQWSDWFEAAGLCNIQSSSTIRTDSTAIALEMAMDGEGITLINGPFADKDLAAGRLVQPSPHSVKDFGEWGIACRKDMSEQPHIKAFIEWMEKDTVDYR